MEKEEQIFYAHTARRDAIPIYAVDELDAAQIYLERETACAGEIILVSTDNYMFSPCKEFLVIMTRFSYTVKERE